MHVALVGSQEVDLGLTAHVDTVEPLSLLIRALRSNRAMPRWEFCDALDPSPVSAGGVCMLGLICTLLDIYFGGVQVVWEEPCSLPLPGLRA